MIAGSTYRPRTRIRRQGLAASRSIKMRGLFRQASIYLALFFVFALAYVWMRNKVVELGYKISHLESVQEKLKEENRSLMVEAATLKSPQRLEVIASQMGLHRPGESQVYIVKDSVKGSP